MTGEEIRNEVMSKKFGRRAQSEPYRRINDPVLIEILENPKEYDREQNCNSLSF